MYNYNDLVQEDEMGEAFSMDGAKRMHIGYWWDVGEWIILRWILERIGWCELNWSPSG
jgi:hypothetical protein